MPTSQNGYPANDVTATIVRRIPGTARDVRLAKGEPGWLLLHYAAWFDQHIEPLDVGQLDDWGYAERPIRGSTSTLSNHASGTALDLNAVRHPLGKRGTFTPAQAAAIRRQLERYDGALRWGGDYTQRADEMHVEVIADRAKVREVARRIRREDREAALVQLPTKVADALLATVVVAQVRAAFKAALAGHPGPARGGVKVLQRNLNRRYHAGLTVDGIVGPATLDAWRTHEQHVGPSGRPAIPDLRTVLALSSARFLVK